MTETMDIAYVIPAARTIAKTVPAHIKVYTHLPVCVENTIRFLWERFIYEWHWPNYCHHCDGWGITEYYENQSPIGSGEYWPMRMTEPCICLTGDEMVCPRCATPIYDIIGSDQRLLQSRWFPFEVSDDPEDAINRWFDDMRPCPVCGWNWGKPPGQEEMEMRSVMGKLGISIPFNKDALGSPWECCCWEEMNPLPKRILY